MTRSALALVMCLAFACAGYAWDASQTGAASSPGKLPPNVTPAKLIHQEAPKYPKDAKKAGVSGAVVLKGTIAKDGSVKDLEYVSGPDMLVDSAIKAVKKWKYEPMLINGKPVDVSTKISVVFDPNRS